MQPTWPTYPFPGAVSMTGGAPCHPSPLSPYGRDGQRTRARAAPMHIGWDGRAARPTRTPSRLARAPLDGSARGTFPVLPSCRASLGNGVRGGASATPPALTVKPGQRWDFASRLVPSRFKRGEGAKP
jgi:hypothetical protein